MEHSIASSKSVTIRVHLLRSTKPQRCPGCGQRRILYAIALYPAGLSPETWACAEDMGIRLPGVSVAPRGTGGDVPLPLWGDPDDDAPLPAADETFAREVLGEDDVDVSTAPPSLAEGGNVFYAEDFVDVEALRDE